MMTDNETCPLWPQGVQYGGRRLDVCLALSHEEVERLKEDKSGGKGSTDKRNLYLAKEGGEWVDLPFLCRTNNPVLTLCV